MVKFFKYSNLIYMCQNLTQNMIDLISMIRRGNQAYMKEWVFSSKIPRE